MSENVISKMLFLCHFGLTRARSDLTIAGYELTLSLVTLSYVALALLKFLTGNFQK